MYDYAMRTKIQTTESYFIFRELSQHSSRILSVFIDICLNETINFAV